MKVLNISSCVAYKEELWEGGDHDKQQHSALNKHARCIFGYLSSFMWILKTLTSICKFRVVKQNHMTQYLPQRPSPVFQSTWAKWPPRSALVWTSTCWAWTGFLIPAAAGWWKQSWVSDISQANLPGIWLSRGNRGMHGQNNSLDKNIMCLLWSCCAEVNHLKQAVLPLFRFLLVPAVLPEQYILLYLRCQRILLWKGNKPLHRPITLMKTLLFKHYFSFRYFSWDKYCFSIQDEWSLTENMPISQCKGPFRPKLAKHVSLLTPLCLF